jgi:hypothetical protein
MKFMCATYFALLVTMVWLASCARPQQTQQSQGMITEARALELAKAEFAKTGRSVNDYAISIETDSTGQKWIAWFDKKGAYAMPGGKHAVTVEKTTGKTVFMQGE